MEETFRKLSPCIDILLKYWDEAAMKRPCGELGEAAFSIDPSCAAKITEALAKQGLLSAQTEAAHVFSAAVGKAARWFVGCKCHDCIWTMKISDARKQALLSRQIGHRECVWRGRRGSELARGY